MGGTAPAVLSGADAAAVEAFLAGRCTFDAIARICAEVLESHVPAAVGSVEDALEASEQGRRAAGARVG
jgi:1-deoxy-D-xylulose-5-phosphate reductoisomerase